MGLVALATTAGAHDIPNDVKIQAFVKPAGQTLTILVRAPLKAMRDVDFPKVGPGFLDLERADFSLNHAASVWIADGIEVYEDDRLLPKPAIRAVHASLESDRSFASFEEALAHINGPKLSNATQVSWDQTLLDVQLEYPITSDRARFSLHPALARLGLRVITALRFAPPNTPERALEYTGDPGLIRLDPRWHQAALQFVSLGFHHILDGTDHLLFLACLIIPFRRIRGLILVVTSFTVAHSVTLIASAYNLGPDGLWFPPLVETLIAMSIVYMALENIVGVTTVRRRWLVTFAFGLIHGFGFSFALRETLQFAGSHLLTSLLSFNVGVELGQLLVLAVLVPVLALLFRFVLRERIGTIILSALVAHTGWHWMLDRGSQLAQFPFTWPTIDAAFLASAMRWLMLVVLAAGLYWLFFMVLRPRVPKTRSASADENIG